MVALFTDYADYNRLRRNDYAWQTEGYFGLRYRDVGVRALRSGFGVYRGVGGSLEELDALGLEGRKVGLTYGYLEGEYGVTAFTGLIGRLAIGLTNGGVSGGGQFFVRLGNDKLTNILLGGEVLGGIGLKGIAELQWNTIARVPIVIRTEVTNQPAGTAARLADGTTSSEPVSIIRGDVGARAMVQVGYRLVPSLTLSLRGSYERQNHPARRPGRRPRGHIHGKPFVSPDCRNRMPGSALGAHARDHSRRACARERTCATPCSGIRCASRCAHRNRGRHRSPRARQERVRRVPRRTGSRRPRSSVLACLARAVRCVILRGCEAPSVGYAVELEPVGQRRTVFASRAEMQGGGRGPRG
jgi:hypothetical protein